MLSRILAVSLSIAGLLVAAGCGGGTGTPVTGTAAIVGSVAPGPAGGKLPVQSQNGCPDIVVSLNGEVVDVVFNDDCTFLIDGVTPAELVELRVELPALALTQTVELADVTEAELIEILVQADDDSLTITTVRRATPDPVGNLPTQIAGNNVTIFLPAGTYNRSLNVLGNNFTLVGESGDDCDDEGWTIITGDVTLLGNNATFRNVRFEGVVQVNGNNAEFIHCCFGGELIIFGNNTDIDDDDDGDDDDDNDNDGDDDDDDNDNGDDDDDDNDNGDDDDNGNDNDDDNGNDNDDDDNDNGDDDNSNDNDDDNLNDNGDDNGNDNDDDDNGNDNDDDDNDND